jgi:hypothetical protein
VHPGEYRVHDAEPCFTRDASPRNAGSGAHASVSLTSRLDRADDGRSDGNDAPTFRLRLFDCRRSSLRNAIGLIERKIFGQPELLRMDDRQVGLRTLKGETQTEMVVAPLPLGADLFEK